DGIHSLIIGATGAGKSEFLITLLTSLMVKYHPDCARFLLLDYKGGASLWDFEDVPHTGALLTNLSNQIDTFFKVMQEDIDRRWHLLAQYNVKHLIEYRQKGFHLQFEPLPNLFLVIDAADYLIKENQQVLSKLIRIARLG